MCVCVCVCVCEGEYGCDSSGRGVQEIAERYGLSCTHIHTHTHTQIHDIHTHTCNYTH
jgi:hypothetical protein